jgi:hypothetical protein
MGDPKQSELIMDRVRVRAPDRTNFQSDDPAPFGQVADLDIVVTTGPRVVHA